MHTLPHLKNTLLELPRLTKRFLALFADVAFCFISTWLALCLRLESWVYLEGIHLTVILCSVGIALPIFIRFGLYRAVFRYAGWHAIGSVFKALLLYGLFFSVLFTVISIPGVPRSIGIIQPMLLFFLIASSRLFVRYWLGDLYAARLHKRTLPGLMIYGAGNAGRQIAAAIQRSDQHRLAGFIDDNTNLQNQRIDGQRIYHIDDIERLIQQKNIDTVLITIPSLSQDRLLNLVHKLEQFKVRVRILPHLDQLAIENVTLNDLRDIQVEDLLSRDPVSAIPDLLNRDIHAKVVLVTGAGGSIGQELCRQILNQKPTHLILYEINEYSLYSIHAELISRSLNTQLIPILGSIQDSTTFEQCLVTWHPNTIYHAAAYKHVPLVEHNVCAALQNNIWGTLRCASLAMKHQVNRFVLISTDKAVRPTNLMGASKRGAELILQALSNLPSQTCFSMVRFGNVLGSSGSVVPLFKKQIQEGGPITVTDLEITRYFMTIPEAAQLVIQAGAMANGGEVFLLEMGNPVKIYDLALKMIHLSGLTLKSPEHPQGDIEIQITGLRPGEKRFEELLIDNSAQKTIHPRILKAHETFIPWDTLETQLNNIEMSILAHDLPSIREQLTTLVTGYQPHPEIVDWLYINQHTVTHESTYPT